jgi:hypothetical protein
VGERIVERFVDVCEGHAICKAFEDEFDRKTRAPDGELPPRSSGSATIHS